VQAEDMLFATLDPTMRRLKLPSGRIAILSDTVGFVSNLPTQLVAAFRATLEEVLEADLVLHVRDVSHPETDLQSREVHRVLSELGLDEEARQAMVEVQNKIDLLTPVQRQLAGPAAMSALAVPVSAVTGENCSNLLDVIEQRLYPRRLGLRLALMHTAGSAIAWLYQHADVQWREDTEDGVTLSLEITEREFFQFSKIFPAEARVLQRQALAAQ
ncbi:MAG: GTPase, partial [Pseudomonadota bacterium]